MGAVRLKTYGRYAARAMHRNDDLFMGSLILIALSVIIATG